MRMRGGRVITELFPKPHIGGGGVPWCPQTAVLNTTAILARRFPSRTRKIF